MVTAKQTSSYKGCKQWSSTFLAPGTGFMEDKFFTDQGRMVSGWFMHITFIVHFISNLMMLQIWQEVAVHSP